MFQPKHVIFILPPVQQASTVPKFGCNTLHMKNLAILFFFLAVSQAFLDGARNLTSLSFHWPYIWSFIWTLNIKPEGS